MSNSSEYSVHNIYILIHFAFTSHSKHMQVFIPWSN